MFPDVILIRPDNLMESAQDSAYSLIRSIDSNSRLKNLRSKLNLSQKVDYDINKRVSSITNRSSQNGGITETITFFYPDDKSHEVEKSTFIIQSPKGNSGIECVFSAYEYDDKGNWIRRNVRQSTKNASNESESTEYTETRIITYYQ